MGKIKKEMAQNKKKSILRLNRKQTKKKKTNQLIMNLQKEAGCDRAWAILY